MSPWLNATYCTVQINSMCQNSREQTSSLHFPWDCYRRRSNKQNFTWMCYHLANTLTNSSLWTHPLLFGMASSPSSYPSLPSLTLSLMRSLPLSASLFSPSAFLKVFSMFYLCDNHKCFCHSAQCNTGRPLSLYLAARCFSMGDTFYRVCVSPEDRGPEKHIILILNIIFLHYSLFLSGWLWLDVAGEDSLVPSGVTHLTESELDSPAERESRSEPHLSQGLRGWAAEHHSQLF